MLKITTALLCLLASFSAFSQKSCQELNQEIKLTHQLINNIKIPEIKYIVDEYNCSLVEPVLHSTYEVRAHMNELLSLYENLYFDCGKDVDLIYQMEDIKANIVMLTTITSLMKNLHQECSL